MMITRNLTVATSSPSPTQPIDRPRRTGVRQSTSGDEENIPKQK